MGTRYLEKIPADKRLHANLGTAFSFITVILASFIAVNLIMQVLILAILLVIFAWGIEYYQRFTKSGTFDHWDAIAVMLGGLPVIAAYWIGMML